MKKFRKVLVFVFVCIMFVSSNATRKLMLLFP